MGIDTLNNIERIDVDAPIAGDYTIHISGQKNNNRKTGLLLNLGHRPLPNNFPGLFQLLQMY
jgi:hypothetical protein